MRIIAILVSFLVYFNAFAAAPLGVVGQNQTTKLYPAVVKAPNSQTTDLGSATALLETGNKNRLVNPGFEGSISAFSIPGWSSSVTGTAVITYTAETSTYLIEGKKSNIIGCSGGISGGTCTFYQDVTTNQAVQALASIYVNSSSATGVKVFSRVNGANYQSVDVTQALQTGLYKVPVVAGTTSTGVAVQITVAASQSIQTVVDEGFVGAVDLKVDTNNISNWTTYTPTITHASGSATNYTSTANYRRVGDTLEVSGLIKFSNTSGTFSGINASLPSGLSIDSSKIPSSTVLDFSIGDGAVYDSGVLLVPAKVYYSSTTVVDIRYMATSTGTNPVNVSSGQLIANNLPTTFGANDTISYNFKVPIAGWGSSGSIYSQPYYATDRIGEIIFTSNTTAPSGFISALGSSIGQSGSGATFTGDAYYPLYEHLWSLAGLSTTAGDPYRISSAKGASASSDWSAGKTITIDYATNELFVRAKGSSRNVGSYQDSDNKSHSHSFTTYRAHTTIDNFLVGRGAATPAQDVSTTASGGSESRPKNVALFAYVRFQADNQIIVGQFNGLESCADTYQCTDVYSAHVNNAGVVQRENLDWISGNCSKTATGRYSCTLRSGLFTVNPVCTITSTDGQTILAATQLTNTTTLNVSTTAWNIADPFYYDSGFFVICQKQGADYIGKTAKAVASDQNVRSVGSIGVDIQSVYFGATSSNGCVTSCTTGTCGICNQVGSKITSVTWVTGGNYRLNGIDGTKYNCHGTGFNGSVNQLLLGNRAASSSTYAQIESPNAVGYASVTCIGIP